jgi:RNA polymerase sigma-70 factor (ECF subfamily)
MMSRWTTSVNPRQRSSAMLYANNTQVLASEYTWVGIVQSIAARDQLALHALYTRMHGIVFTWTMQFVSDWKTAEELTLDVFHDAWRKASTYDPAGDSVVGWILNLARSKAIDRLRSEHRTPVPPTIGTGSYGGLLVTDTCPTSHGGPNGT